MNLQVEKAVGAIAASLFGAGALAGAPSGHAESCGMNGCYRPGYIFIPDRDFELRHPIPNTLNGMPCAAAQDVQTFAQPGLPLVNQTTTIKAFGKHIFFEPLEPAALAGFSPVEQHFAADRRSCAADWREPEGWRIEPGAKVRILGYRTFVGQQTSTVRDPKTGLLRTSPTQLLFAMVLVINR